MLQLRKMLAGVDAGKFTIWTDKVADLIRG